SQMRRASSRATNTSAALTFSKPAGTTARVGVSSARGRPRAGIDSAASIQAAAGATPTRSFTIAPTTTEWAGITIGLKPNTTGTLAFDVQPDAPALSAVALNGQAQTTNATMGGVTVSDTTGSTPGTGSGWNVTVVGDASAGKSAVFKQYCNSGSACNGGADPANSYVTGGRTLPAG